MTSSISQTQLNTSQGLCPHGLPPAMCPICSKMGAGGMKKEKPKPQAAPKEWSYTKCYIEGLRLKALKNQKENAEIQAQKMFEKVLNQGQKLSQFILNIKKNINEKILNFIEKAPVILKAMAKIALSFVINPILNIASQIPKVIHLALQIAQNVNSFIMSVSEKLSSFLGEIKNFLQNKKEKDIKKKLKDLFSYLIETTEKTTVGETNNNANQPE